MHVRGASAAAALISSIVLLVLPPAAILILPGADAQIVAPATQIINRLTPILASGYFYPDLSCELTDGSTATGFAHSFPDGPNPWYRIDLMTRRTVTRARIFPRTGFSFRSNAIAVYVGDDRDNPVARSVLCKASGANPNGNNAWRDLPCDGSYVTGRFVFFRAENCGGGCAIDPVEFEVYAVTAPSIAFPVADIALSAGFSPSTIPGYPPSNAIDRNFDSLSHDNGGVNLWLGFDTGSADTPIYQINVLTRRDCCWEREGGSSFMMSNSTADITGGMMPPASMICGKMPDGSATPITSGQSSLQGPSNRWGADCGGRRGRYVALKRILTWASYMNIPEFFAYTSRCPSLAGFPSLPSTSITLNSGLLVSDNCGVAGGNARTGSRCLQTCAVGLVRVGGGWPDTVLECANGDWLPVNAPAADSATGPVVCDVTCPIRPQPPLTDWSRCVHTVVDEAFSVATGRLGDWWPRYATYLTRPDTFLTMHEMESAAVVSSGHLTVYGGDPARVFAVNEPLWSGGPFNTSMSSLQRVRASVRLGTAATFAGLVLRVKGAPSAGVPASYYLLQLHPTNSFGHRFVRVVYSAASNAVISTDLGAAGFCAVSTAAWQDVAFQVEDRRLSAFCGATLMGSVVDSVLRDRGTAGVYVSSGFAGFDNLKVERGCDASTADGFGGCPVSTPGQTCKMECGRDPAGVAYATFNPAAATATCLGSGQWSQPDFVCLPRISVPTDKPFEVVENSRARTAVGSAFTIPNVPESLFNWTIASSAPSPAPFFVDTDCNGQLRVVPDGSVAVDFETAPSYSLTVGAFFKRYGPATTFVASPVTVTVIDINEPPVYSGATAFSVPETAAPGTVIGLVSFFDVDYLPAVVDIAIGNDDGAFNLTTRMSAPGAPNVTYGLTVGRAGLFSFCLQPVYDLVLACTDTGAPASGRPALTASATVRVSLTEVLQPPRFVASTLVHKARELSPDGTTTDEVFVRATDPNCKGPLTFSMVNPSPFFNIRPDGAVFVNTTGRTSTLDFTRVRSVVLLVAARSAFNFTSQANVTVNIVQTNTPPAFPQGQVRSIFENATALSAAGVRLNASDAQDTVLVYTIVGGTGADLFFIDNQGVVRVGIAGAFDVFGPRPVYTLDVMVQDAGTPDGIRNSANATVNITVLWSNRAPVASPQTFTLREDAAVGSVAGAINASDRDARAPINDALTHAILSQEADSFGFAAPFAMSSAGAVTLAAGARLLFEGKRSYVISYRSTDAFGASATSTATVQLAHVNKACWIQQNVTLFARSRTAGTVGAPLTAFLRDWDLQSQAAETHTWAFVDAAGQNIDNTFAISSATGQITVATPAATFFFTGSVYNLTVRATDAGIDGAALSCFTNINVTVIDSNNPPTLAGQSYTVPERSATGFSLGTITGSDPDQPQQSLFYRLDPAGPNVNRPFPFRITTLNSVGTIVVDTSGSNGQVDFEGAPYGGFAVYQAAVTVTDSHPLAPLSATVPVTITVTDVAEAPFFAPLASAPGQGNPGVPGAGRRVISAPENDRASCVAPAAVVSGESTAAADQDAADGSGSLLAYAWDAASNPPAVASRFSVDAATGAVSVLPGAVLDFETSPTYTGRLKVTDRSGRTDVADVVINIADVNESPFLASPPVQLANGTLAPLFVVSATASPTSPADAALGLIRGRDVDTNLFDGTLSYALVGSADACAVGGGAGVFSVNATTGEVSLDPSGPGLDWEDCAYYGLQVRVADGGFPAPCAPVLTVGVRVEYRPVAAVASLRLAAGEQAAGRGVDIATGATSYTASQPSGVLALIPTAGPGAAVELVGTKFGFTANRIANEGAQSNVIGVTFGPTGTEFAMGGCAVALPNTVIRCTTMPSGVGTGFLVRVVFNGAVSTTMAAARIGYMPPIISTVVLQSEDSLDPSTALMPTSGGSAILLDGQYFGPIGTPVSITYGTLLQEGAPVPTIDPASAVTVPSSACSWRAADRAVTCTARPGFGSNLGFTLTVGGQTSGVFSATRVAYRAPSVASISLGAGAVAGGASDGASAVDTLGGTEIVILGTDLSASGVGSAPLALELSLDFSDPVAPVYSATACRVATAHVRVICAAPPGVGGPLVFRLTVGNQRAASDTPTSLRYAQPVVTALAGLGARLAQTTGGQSVILSGRNFGLRTPVDADGAPPIGWAAGVNVPLVRYGRPGSNGGLLSYLAVGCLVTSNGAQIICETAPGTGRDLVWSVTLGRQRSPLTNFTSDYSPPVVTDYAGATAAVDQSALDTLGGEGVFVDGRNFGPVGTPITRTTYGPTGAEFVAAACAVLVDHTRISCLSAPGAGVGHVWRIVIDGQESVEPSTSYAPPEVHSFSGPAAADADPAGGQQVVITGRNFNRFDALLTSVTYGPSGAEYAAAGCTITVPSTEIRCRTVPGTGRSLSWVVTVGGQASNPSAALTSYAQPLILLMDPPAATTLSPAASPTRVTLVTRNLPLFDTSARFTLAFGQGASRLLLPVSVPQGAAAVLGSTNSDGSVNVSFTLPLYHAGVGIGVKIDVFAGPGAVPVVSTPLTPATSFAYLDPVIDNIIITRALFWTPAGNETEPPPGSGDYIACPFSTSGGSSGWDCSDPSVVQLTILGSHFGPPDMEAPGAAARYGVARSLAFADFGYNPAAADAFRVDPAALFPYSFSPSMIVVFGRVTRGAVRLTLATFSTWAGAGAVQAVNRTFENVNPTISALSGATDNIPTAGAASPLSITVLDLAGATDVKVFVGGAEARIVCRAGGAGDEGPCANVRADVISAQSGSWVVRALIPAGQGRGVPVQVVSYNNGEPKPSNAQFTIDYAPPTLSRIGVRLAGEAEFTYRDVTLASLPTLRVPTDGSATVRFLGANFGTAPVLRAGDGATVAFAAMARCDAFSATGLPHSCVEMLAPQGEGTGEAYPEYQGELPIGFKAFVAAGNQDSNKVPFRYLEPAIASVASLAAGAAFPTTGGAPLAITGSNFGFSRRFVDGAVQVTFARAGEGAASPLVCSSVVRVSHSRITCTLPEGSGKDLVPTVVAAGVRGSSAGAAFSYDRPALLRAYVVPAGAISELSTDISTWTPAGAGVTPLVVIQPGVNIASELLRANTTGGDWVVLEGTNFGRNDSARNCAFMTWKHRPNDPASAGAAVHTCDQQETWLGEGEVPAQGFSGPSALGWTHTRIAFRALPGVGTKEIQLSIRGNTLAQADVATFRYNDPVVHSLSPGLGDTEGGDLLTLVGFNFGPGERDTVNDPVNTFPVPLSAAPSLPVAYVVITFHSTCVAFPFDTLGRLVRSVPVTTATGPTTLDRCSAGFVAHDHGAIVFRSPAGVGARKNITVQVVDGPVVQASGAVRFSYQLPAVRTFAPRPVLVSAPGALASVAAISSGAQPVFDVLGRYFGNFDLADLQNWSEEERGIFGRVAGFPCSEVRRRREQSEEDGGQLSVETIVSCAFDPAVVPVGALNFSLTIAGQSGFRGSEPVTSRTLVVGCAFGSYARPGEVCLPCVAQNENPSLVGAVCRGFVPAAATAAEAAAILAAAAAGGSNASSASAPSAPLSAAALFARQFTYPVPLRAWYNLNSSDSYSQGVSMMPACPEGRQDSGRDVCIVPCEPPEACLGDNVCANGYTSKAPQWRCSFCDRGFFRRAGECVRCPDSPYALIIGFVALVIVVGAIGFVLNKRQVNIAVISIGVDFFQVLAIFAQSRIKWPPIVKELLHVLSAFNLNLEIVAPECIIPDVSYMQKFFFIMLLPLSVGTILLGGIFTSLWIYKMACKGLPRRRWFSHKPTLISSTLVLLYMLYLYLTRTIFDVFNCTPTMPPDGYTYLSVANNERCGIPGGTQVTLLPYAVAGLAVYVAGYPAFIGYTLWTNREVVMEDQLLRAKGAGADRLSNPHAYGFRKQYGRAYFQFKPDFCLWILAIVARKFCIAITAVVFNRNSSFQMAACLLIMFLAYAAQVQIRPYMSPGDFEEVLKSHAESAATSAIHARLRSAIAGIETRGRKKGRKNLIRADGKVDRNAVFGVLAGWLFNYNTVEQIMIFAAVIVCLMAIMYQANELSTYYPESKDSVTAVILLVIIVGIVYFFTVLITEVVVLYNEAHTAKMLARQARGSSSGAAGGGKGKKGGMEDGSSYGAGGGRGGNNNRLLGEDGELNVGKLDTHVNPLFTTSRQSGGGGGGGGGAGGAGGSGASSSSSSATAYGGPSASTLETIMAQRDAPAQELWMVFQSEFSELTRQLEKANSWIVETKRREARSDGGGGGGEGGGDGGAGAGGGGGAQDLPAASRQKKSFVPVSAVPAAAAARGGSGSLKSLRAKSGGGSGNGGSGNGGRKEEVGED